MNKFKTEAESLAETAICMQTVYFGQ